MFHLQKGFLETAVHSVTCFPPEAGQPSLYKHYLIPPSYHSIYLRGKAGQSSTNYTALELHFTLLRSLWKPIEPIDAVKKSQEFMAEGYGLRGK